MESPIHYPGFTGLLDCGYSEFIASEKKRYAVALAGRDPKDIKLMIDLLRPDGGETPLDATRGLVQGLEEIEKALEEIKPGNNDMVATVEGVAVELAAARTAEQKLRKSLRPKRDEGLVDAAQRLMGSVESSRRKAQALEKEISPLRRLAELTSKLSSGLMKHPVKLHSAITDLLQETAALLGVKFEIKFDKKGKEGHEIQ